MAESKKKISVITGSSKGIGKAIAMVFAKSKQYSGVVTNHPYRSHNVLLIYVEFSELYL